MLTVRIPVAHRVVVSSVKRTELLYGLAKGSYPKGITTRIHEFFIRVTILAWDKNVEPVY
ncbi:MAG: hypothetical protein WCK85_11645 [Chlorobium sp.]